MGLLGGSHKCSMQRGVLAVRASVQGVVEALGEETVDLATARERLIDVERALRSLEVKLSMASLRESQQLDRLEMLGPCEPHDPQFEHSNPDTAKWLLNTFTEHKVDAAESGFEKQVSRTFSIKARRSMFFPPHRAVSEPAVAAVMAKCGGHEFDALALAAALEGTEHQPISTFGEHLLQYRRGLVDCLRQRGWVEASSEIFTRTFVAFLSRLDTLYRPDVRYHNAAHAVDIMASMDFFMRSNFVLHRSTSLDHIMAWAAAAAHDVGHPGKNAMFHVKTMSSLAIRYNDKSILENMHASLAFQTMQQNPDSDWLALLAKDAESHQMSNLQQYVRQGIIGMILATDMAKHQQYVLKLASMLEHAESAAQVGQAGQVSSEKPEALEDKCFILETLLHAADLSNPCKPRSIALGWTQRVCEEFWLQGDEERELGLAISPMCDRVAGAVAVPQGQLGFINFVVRPLFNPLAELAVEIQQATNQLAENAAFWEEQAAQGASFLQLFGEDPSM